MTEDEAYIAVARMILSGCANRLLLEAKPPEGDCPPLTEQQWLQVRLRALDLTPIPDAEEYVKACSFLDARADAE